MKRVFVLISIAMSLAACSENRGPAVCDESSIIALNPDKEVIPGLLSARRNAARHDSPDALQSLTLLHFTDLHGARENLERIVEFYDYYDEYIDDAIHTGDGVTCYYDDVNWWNEVAGARRILNIVGNHDNWKGKKVWAETNYPYDATQEDVYKSVMTGNDASNPFVKGWGVIQPQGADNPDSEDFCACYYYKDYPSSKVRMIVLDCMHYFERQDAWFREVLSDAQEKGLLVIGVTHFPPQSGLDIFESGFSPLHGRMEGVPDPVDSQMERMPDAAYSSVDWFIGNGGKFVCWLSGHTHSDYIGTVAGHGGQVVVIVDKGGEGDGYMTEDRTPGTRNQDAFNLVTVNPSKGIFVVDRIGCNRDSMMRSKKLFVFDYANGKILVNE